jgi:hypothetical protein
MLEILLRVLEGGLFTFLGVVTTLYFARNKNQGEVRKLQEETERLKIENQNLVQVQMNTLVKQNTELMKERQELEQRVGDAMEIAMEEARKKMRPELDRIHKGQEDLKAELYIANQEKLNLSKELMLQRIEIAEQQKKNEKVLESQQKDISKIKLKTGQLPEQLPEALEHK